MTLKPRKTPQQVFEKIQKKIKPTGSTAKWRVTTDENELTIDFGDGASETFCLCFHKKQARGFCKVAFPMGGELFENKKKSEWKTLIGILHSVKPLCSEIEVDDDYSIAGEYFTSLDYTFGLRELTAAETERLDRIFQSGYMHYEAFLLQIFAEATKRALPENWEDAINPLVGLNGVFPKISALWETYIYETSTLKKKCLREIYLHNWRTVNGKMEFFGDPPAEIYTFGLGVGRLFSAYDFIDNTWGRGTNITKFYNDKFLPEFEQADDYGKCRLAYQFMLSVYDYCKFQFVGKDAIQEMIDAFEKKYNTDGTPPA